MTIFIERGKTDNYIDGQWVASARTESKICPVKKIRNVFSDGVDFLQIVPILFFVTWVRLNRDILSSEWK